jgi:putative cell wall-binding protein
MVQARRTTWSRLAVMVIVTLAMAVAAAPAGAQTVTYPAHLTWTHHDFGGSQVPSYPDGNRGFFNIDSEITVEAHEPGTAMYYARTFGFVGAGDLGGGYLGLQSRGRVGDREVPKSLIFSIWDAAGARPAADGGSTCEAFGHEGSGYSCMRELDWQVDRTYVLRVWTTTPGWWGAWVIDTVTGAEVQIGEIHVADQRQWLSARNLFFTETFGHGTFACEELPHSRVRWGPPSADNGAVHPEDPPYTYGVSSDDFPGAAGCLDVARGWNDGAEAVHDVGLARHSRDVMSETVAYLHRVAHERSPTRQELRDGLARFAADCVEGHRGLVRDIALGTELAQRHEAHDRLDVLYRAALHRNATRDERESAVTSTWAETVERVVTSPELTHRAGVLCGSRSATPPPVLDRLSGRDRIGTAAAIAAEAFPHGADTVYLARADVFADALAAGSLSDGPVLLVPSCGAVPEPVRSTVAALDPDEVVALGGGGAVCDAMLAAAAEGRDVDRLGGRTRTETAVAIAQRSFPDGAAEVYLASAADSSPDAVAGGTLLGGPILLTGPAGPDAATAAEITRLEPERVVALGGAAAVGDTALAAAAGDRDALRVAGRTRIETAVAISEFGFAPHGSGPRSLRPGRASTVYLARADVFADAVAGGALTGGPILLVPSCGTLPEAVADLITDLAPERVVALGGSAAVCDGLLEAAGA